MNLTARHGCTQTACLLQCAVSIYYKKSFWFKLEWKVCKVLILQDPFSSNSLMLSSLGGFIGSSYLLYLDMSLQYISRGLRKRIAPSEAQPGWYGINRWMQECAGNMKFCILPFENNGTLVSLGMGDFPQYRRWTQKKKLAGLRITRSTAALCKKYCMPSICILFITH